jgi:PAS domain S-box-containing protein
VLANRISQGEKYSVYRCRNGLIDVAVPIIIDGIQIGRLYTGQFLFAPPDMGFFKRQAEEYGFDEASYLDAVRKVPIVTEERVRQVMVFLSRLAEIIVRMGVTNKRIDDADLIVRKSPAVLFRWRPCPGWPIEYVSDNVIQFGYSPEEIISREVPYASMVYPDDLERVVSHVEEHSKRGEELFQLEYRLVTKGGDVRWVNEHTTAERDGEGLLVHYRGIVIDITERKRTEALLRSSLEEKEILLKEIHHRVKNNLQIVSTLLDLQTENIRDERIISSFRESQHRICAMALIHESIYKSADIASVNFGKYIRDLSYNLANSYLADPGRIDLNVRCGEIDIEIDQAIPCGLIVNELVSNALKHAFPDNRTGEISIEFHREEGGRFTLKVADNGVGMPEGLDFTKTDTLGLQLVNTLARQLRGEVRIEGGQGGTAFIITFPGSRSVGGANA